ncbi:hypothetical protein ACEU2D_20080 [Brevibacillus laterosporus]|uniref:hypothetical protein n=1 Tax=Brevibacillus laterosporus TaxID=1465 RepID=UPI0035A6868C
MAELLYYPGFEIEDEEWLKFALLYLNKVDTIVPYQADNLLSDQYKFLIRETNLLDKYRPNYDEAGKSTMDVINIISKYLANPIQYFGILGKVNILDFWRERRNQDFELFQNKFSYYFEQFCRENGLSHDTVNGIKIPRQLGLIYMSILAHNIGDRNGISVITDMEEQRQLSKINEQTWRYNKRLKEIKAVRKLIELRLPVDLKQIPIKDIIRLRNQESYQRKLKAFHAAVSEFSSLPNKKLTEHSYYEIESHIKYTKEDLKADIINFSMTTSAAILGVSIVLSDNGSGIEFSKEVLGIETAIGGALPIYRKLGSDRRLAARYLTDLKVLGRNSRWRNVSRLF